MTQPLGSAEWDRERPARPRKVPKKLKKTKKIPRPAAAASPPAPSWWDDSWHWLGLGLGCLVTPYMAVSLTLPAWTGALGSWIGGTLYQSFGLSALLLPGVTGSLALHLLLPRSRRPLQLSWAPACLWLDLVWLSQRMGGQGGWLGHSFDSLVVGLLGPMGSWMSAGLMLVASSLAVCRIPLGRVVRGTAHLFVETVERGARLITGLRLPARAPQYVSGEGESVAPASEAPAALPATFVADPSPAASGKARSGLLPARPEQSTPTAVASREPEPKAEPAGRRYIPLPDPEPEPEAEFEDDREAELPSAEPQPELPPESLSSEPSAEILSGEQTAASGEAPGVEPEVLWAHEPPPEQIPELEELGLESLEETVREDEAPAAVALEETVSDSVAPVETAPAAVTAQPATAGRTTLVDPDGQLRLFPSAEKPAQPKYRLPPLTLLQEGLAHQRPRVEDKSEVLLDALASFGVQASLLQIVQGPTVTRYELQPARGVKVSRFTSLTNDIALALAAKAVRIEAPIPGKSAVGIEIPNQETELVTLRDILGSSRFKKSQGMSIALGKDLQGTPTFANLQKMPHLLVAGTTGSGKSVCINGLIMSLLYRFTPRELQLLMIDPKQVELSIYEGIPHLISLAKNVGDSKDTGAIICDPKRAAMALHQIVELMEYRYGLFAGARVRNLEEYNQAGPEPLPWVVVIIDELADLMMVASKSVETSICRIAQKARAAGIHLVLATQRPSADVITGLIKVNVPSRIAFAVSSQVDSRVILDSGGAEQLLGKGDMLFCPVDASDPRRLQGCFVNNDEILRVVEWWRAQASPDNLIQLQVSDVVEELAEEEEGNEDDALVEQALQVVLRRQQASASLLQTELKVGYARARRLIYLMEKKGYIGPAEGSKPRKILYGSA